MAPLLASPPKLPIIDFRKDGAMNPGTGIWRSVQEQVVHALEEYGCFDALYDGITTQHHSDVVSQVEDLFNFPPETKRRFVDSRKPLDGYIDLYNLPPGIKRRFSGPPKPLEDYLANQPYSPLYEAMGVGAVLDGGGFQNLSHVMWPQGNRKFCETLNSYARKLSELDQLLTKMVFEAWGVEKYLNSHAKSLNYSVRIMKYEADPKIQEEQLGAPSHCDKNFLTILQQNHVDGLQVQTRDGKWMEAAPSPSSFIVFAGMSFLAWSNGRVYCPRHRVMIRGKDTRYSFGLFSSIRGMIECPKELVDAQHPQLFKPFDEVGLLCFHDTGEGYKGELTLKAYCGL